jgi:hypothetical protein
VQNDVDPFAKLQALVFGRNVQSPIGGPSPWMPKKCCWPANHANDRESEKHHSDSFLSNSFLIRANSRDSRAILLMDPKYLGAKPGIISALHTWGRNLSVHPHAHCLVTAGGIAADGQFIPLEGQTLLPAKVLMTVFRGKLRHRLKQAIDEERLTIPRSTTAARLHSLLNRLGRTCWNVRIQQRYPHGVSVAGYLARYITGGPVSNRRIHAVTDTSVSFWYRDHRDGKRKLMTLSPDDFLSRWFEHIPPRGLRMIRRSGLYANSCSRKREEIRRQILGPDVATSPVAAADEVLKVKSLEPERCSVCNTEVICREPIIAQTRPFHRPEMTVALNQPP